MFRKLRLEELMNDRNASGTDGDVYIRRFDFHLRIYSSASLVRVKTSSPLP